MTADQLKALISQGLACTSSEFEGRRPIWRHQRVYATLGQRMQTDEVHALSMKTYTPAEWAAQGGR